MSKKLDLIKQCGKLFRDKQEDLTEAKADIIKEEDYVGYTDPSNVCMVIPKLKSVKTILLESFDISESKIPELVYVMESKERPKCKYSRDYLRILLEITKKSESEGIQFELKEDFPLRVECKELIFILAPRVEGN